MKWLISWVGVLSTRLLESSTSIVPVYRALRGKGYTIIVQARPYVVIADL